MQDPPTSHTPTKNKLSPINVRTKHHTSELSSIIHCNINGLHSKKNKGKKIKLLQDFVRNENVIIISLTESHLKPYIKDAEINIEPFIPFRTDRANKRRKGGVINYIREEFASDTSITLSISNEYTEVLLLHIKSQNLLFGTVYRPPDCPTHKFVDSLKILTEKINEFGSPTPNIVITGDFNFPIINWAEEKIEAGGSLVQQEQAAALLNLVNKLCLEQSIIDPTREANTLDIFLTNNDQLLHSILVADSALSDHRLITANCNICTKTQPKLNIEPKNTEMSFKDLNFFNTKTNWDKIKNELDTVNWEMILANKSVDEKHSEISNICLKICEKYVPKRKPVRKSLIPRDRRILMLKRSELYKKLVPSKDITVKNSIYTKIEKIENNLLVSHENERQLNEALAISAIKSNPKFFYKYATKNTKIKAKIGPLIQDKLVTSDPEAICEILRKQYDSVFSKPTNKNKVNNPRIFFSTPINDIPSLKSIQFQQEDIMTAIKSISNNAAAGPDNFPAILLKTCANELSTPLYHLWKTSLNTGKIPVLLKNAIITPIYKGGSRGEAQNYRPVALTSHVIKIFEKIVVKKITTFLEDNQLMNANQHGFRSQRSCLSQLLAHYELILDTLESNNSADVIYLDFAKAFDKVDHGILLHKLKALNITGDVAVWIHDFLSGRKQQVVVDGTLSEKSSVISGVPQGSVLGPLLFLILISDINKKVEHSHVSSFADDTRVLKKINKIEDCSKLQYDLEKIYEWANENNMCFNSCKFERIRYKYSNGYVPYSPYLSNDGTEIEEKVHIRDLGVSMSNSATFQNHINAISKASRMKLGWILRTFQTRDKLTMVTLWKALVVPVLDYCSQLWCPWEKGDIRTIEGVQRTFTNRITEISHLNYWQRLKILNMYSLERRRERYIIIYVWKMISGLVPNIGITTKTHSRHGRTCKVRKIATNATCRIKTICAASLRVRGCALFNTLPKAVRTSNEVTVDGFKRQLDKYLATVADEPALPHYSSRSDTNSLIDQARVMRADRATGTITGGGPPRPVA